MMRTPAFLALCLLALLVSTQALPQDAEATDEERDLRSLLEEDTEIEKRAIDWRNIALTAAKFLNTLGETKFQRDLSEVEEDTPVERSLDDEAEVDASDDLAKRRVNWRGIARKTGTALRVLSQFLKREIPSEDMAEIDQESDLTKRKSVLKNLLKKTGKAYKKVKNAAKFLKYAGKYYLTREIPSEGQEEINQDNDLAKRASPWKMYKNYKAYKEYKTGKKIGKTLKYLNKFLNTREIPSEDQSEIDLTAEEVKRDLTPEVEQEEAKRDLTPEVEEEEEEAKRDLTPEVEAEAEEAKRDQAPEEVKEDSKRFFIPAGLVRYAGKYLENLKRSDSEAYDEDVE